jgi:hypothetical protein
VSPEARRYVPPLVSQPAIQQTPTVASEVIAITNSSQVVFTTPANLWYDLRGFLIANTTGADINVTVNVRRTGTTFTILGAVTVPLNDTLEWAPGGGNFYMKPADLLQVFASAASGLVGHFSLHAVR